MFFTQVLLAVCCFWAVSGGGVDIDAQNNDGNTPLHLATERKNEQIMSLLLEHGARSDIKNNDGLTPLDIAEKGRSLGVIALLLKDGSVIDPKRTDGSTYFHVAIEKQNLTIGTILLNKGAHVNAQRNDGSTPLHIATKAKVPNTIRWLLKHGARTDIRNKAGLTPIDVARKAGSWYVIYLLRNPPKPTREGLDIDAQDNNGDTPLHLATERKFEAIMSVLLDYGARTDIRNNAGLTPLDVAEKGGSLGVIALLLEDGDAINPARSDGSTYFHTSVEEANLTISNLLLEKGADIDAQRSDETTPLMIAVERKDVQYVGWLLRKGACAYDKDIRNRTAFSIASEGKDPLVLKTLLKHSLAELKCVSRPNLCHMFRLVNLVKSGAHNNSHTAANAYVTVESFVTYLLNSETGNDSFCIRDDSKTVSLLQREDLRSLLRQCHAYSGTKAEKYDDSADISLYDILKEDVIRIARHLEEDRVIRLWCFDHLRAVFPVDGAAINQRFQDKFRLRERGVESFSLLSSEYSLLTASELRERIVDDELDHGFNEVTFSRGAQEAI